MKNLLLLLVLFFLGCSTPTEPKTFESELADLAVENGYFVSCEMVDGEVRYILVKDVWDEE